MIPEREAIQNLLKPVRAPLLWRVMPWTFFSVVLVQLMSLYPLTRWHQQQLYDHRFQMVNARLDMALAAFSGKGSLADVADAVMHPGIRGLALYAPSGELLQSRGDAPPVPPVPPGPAGEPYRHAKLDAHTIAVSWNPQGPKGLHAAVTLNIDPETKRQEQFVLRAAALSIPSALIATLVGTVILLRGVILPVGRLRDELLRRDAGHLPENGQASIDGLDDLRVFVDQLTQARASAQAMAVLAVTDELTSLYTRRYFNDALELQLNSARRDHTELSVAMIDVDRFKSINDTYGHTVGDEVLKAVAKTCRETLRTGDILARFGGEEFVVLLPNTGVEGAGAVAEKVRCAIEREVRFPRPVTVSVGTSTWCSRQDPTGEALLRRADEALYVAKHTGRNRVVQAEVPSARMATAAS